MTVSSELRTIVLQKPDIVALQRRVGHRLRATRVASGMTQAQLGTALGLSFQQIQKYENGIDAIPLHRLLTVAALFNFTPSYLWSESGTQHSEPDLTKTYDKTVTELVIAYRRIQSPEIRKRLLRLVKEMAGT